MEPQYIKQLSFMSVNGPGRKWQPERTYGGKLVENITQAVARDFLVSAMFRVEARGYPIIATVHDEVVSEREIGQGSLREFDTHGAVPIWGKGCPIAVEGYEAERYRK